jgi:hypothetical protein
MLREADFAYKQAFALCPYSPEAVFRFINLLLHTRRNADALLVAETCLRLDPYNGQAKAAVDSIRAMTGEK